MRRVKGKEWSASDRTVGDGGVRGRGEHKPKTEQAKRGNCLGARLEREPSFGRGPGTKSLVLCSLQWLLPPVSPPPLLAPHRLLPFRYREGGSSRITSRGLSIASSLAFAHSYPRCFYPTPASPPKDIMTTPSLKGKTVFITGASRGIGRAIALRYEPRGTRWGRLWIPALWASILAP